MLSLLTFLLSVIVFVLGVWKATELLRWSREKRPPLTRPSSVVQYDLPSHFRVTQRKTFMVRSERELFEKLLASVPGDVYVFAGVRLQDIFNVDPADEPTRRRLWEKHVDFLLVRKSDYRMLVAIELDGDSHDSAEQQKRDAVKDLLFQSARLPLVRLSTRAPQSASSLQALLRPYWV